MATPARPTREWSQRAEQHAMQLHPALLEAARRNTAAHPDPVLLLGLAREIALTRGAELVRAYRNLVMVQPGFRKHGEGEAEVVTREPCVVFVVRRKWRGSITKAKAKQQLPQWLLAFAEIDGARLPFALPTDVQHESGFNRARAHGTASLWLQPPGQGWEQGAAACAVRLDSDEGTELCLLSAQHVFSPAADVDLMSAQGDLAARPLATDGSRLQQPLIATSRPWGGLLRGDQDPLKPSFDVQLARIDDQAGARRVLGGRRLNAAEPWVKSIERLWALGAAADFHLLAPDDNGPPFGRGALSAQLDSPFTLPFALRFRVRQGGKLTWLWVYHDELIKLKVTAASLARAGDSGSAVVVQHGDGSVTLVGLYIGGQDRAGYAIPAWQVFDLGRWSQFPSNAKLTPVSL